MRTLLIDSFPPQFADEPVVSPDSEAPAESARKSARTFPKTAVLASVDALMEVRVGRTVMATPSALSVEEAARALERGLTISPPKTIRQMALPRACFPFPKKATA